MYARTQDLCTNGKDEEYRETEEQRRKPTLGGSVGCDVVTRGLGMEVSGTRILRLMGTATLMLQCRQDQVVKCSDSGHHVSWVMLVPG